MEGFLNNMGTELFAESSMAQDSWRLDEFNSKEGVFAKYPLLVDEATKKSFDNVVEI